MQLRPHSSALRSSPSRRAYHHRTRAAEALGRRKSNPREATAAPAMDVVRLDEGYFGFWTNQQALECYANELVVIETRFALNLQFVHFNISNSTVIALSRTTGQNEMTRFVTQYGIYFKTFPRLTNKNTQKPLLDQCSIVGYARFSLVHTNLSNADEFFIYY